MCSVPDKSNQPNVKKIAEAVKTGRNKLISRLQKFVHVLNLISRMKLMLLIKVE